MGRQDTPLLHESHVNQFSRADSMPHTVTKIRNNLYMLKIIWHGQTVTNFTMRNPWDLLGNFINIQNTFINIFIIKIITCIWLHIIFNTCIWLYITLNTCIWIYIKFNNSTIIILIIICNLSYWKLRFRFMNTFLELASDIFRNIWLCIPWLINLLPALSWFVLSRRKNLFFIRLAATLCGIFFAHAWHSLLRA